MATHAVTNQPPPLENYDVFAADPVLVEQTDPTTHGELHALGQLAGSAEGIENGRQANRNPPELRTHDRYGHRIDEVAYHPAYHALMTVAVEHGLHAAPWADDRPNAHVTRAAKMIVWSQVDAGHTCPISMTYSVVPALRHEPGLSKTWEPRLTSRTYDPRSIPAEDKLGATCGMAMTEKQGGSDVRANTTTATPTQDGHYEITGHKWFCSAPMSDALLVLAQAPQGLSCFLVPRWRPDRTRNGFHIQRLKDKLGDRSNASSEIELDRAYGQRVGDEGAGVRTIIEMVNHTRLDCVLGSAAGMRGAVSQATHHASHRTAFGKRLTDQPLMVNVLADLAVESEAATLTALDLAHTFETKAPWARIVTPVVKYWVCKRNPPHAAEALECLGGNGFVEESAMPRLFRQSPLNGVWEGSGNVICLDVLRAMARSPESVDAYFEVVDDAAHADRRLADAVERVRKELADLDQIEARARWLVESMALVWQGALVVKQAHPSVADAFCASRLDGDGGRAFGTLPPSLDLATIVQRHTPS